MQLIGKIRYCTTNFFQRGNNNAPYVKTYLKKKKTKKWQPFPTLDSYI